MANNQVATSLTIVNNLSGYQAISLTNFTTSAQSLIAAGSRLEMGGSFFYFSGNETPQASTWTAITTSTTAYITLTPSGTAGSQILTAKYAQAAPVFSTSKQGWYTTAASIVRHIGGVYKNSPTSYQQAFLLPAKQAQSTVNVRETQVVNIGVWDMVATASTIVATGIDPAKVLAYQTTLVNDGDETRYTLPIGRPYATAGGCYMQAWSSELDQDGNVILWRLNDGAFTTSSFNDGAINRGWIIFWLGDNHNTG